MTNALRSNSGKSVTGISRGELRVRKTGGLAARALTCAVNAALGHHRAAPMALALASGALMIAMNSMSAQAANGTWVQISPSGAQTLWGTSSNWANGTIADGPGFVADFSTLNPNATINPFINLDSSRSIGQLLFGQAGGSANTWNLANNGTATNILTLDNTGGTGGPVINVKNQIANISLTLAGTNGVTLTGGQGGTAASLILSGANTYSGTTTIHSNSTNLFTIDAANNGAFGNSTIFFDVGASNFGRIMLESGVNIPNNITINTARAPAGANAAIMTTSNVGGNNVSATWSGTITVNGQATSGGDVLGPSSAGTTNFLTLSGPIIDNLGSQVKSIAGGNAFIIRAGNVRMADTTGTSTILRIEDRNGILQIGANNGIATNAYVQLGGNLGNPGGPTTSNVDLNGFNQTLVGVSNYISLTEAVAITNSCTTAPATLTLAPADPTTNPNQALLVFTANASGTATNASITDASASAPLSIVVNGAAAGVQYILTGNGTYRGTTTLTSGTLAIDSLAIGGSSSSIGASSNAASNLVFNGGILQYVNFGVNVSNGNVALSNTFTPSTDRNFTINNGTSGTINVQAANATLTWSGGSAATTGSLIKAGPGTLIMAGTNSHSGGTTVSAGVFDLTGSLATGTTSVSSGATFMGNGTIGGTLSVTSGGILAPGNAGIGTLTTAGLTLNSGSISNFEFGGGNDIVTVTGAGGLNVIGSNLDLYNVGTTNAFSTNGNYTLMNINGGFSGSLSNFTVANPVAGKFYSLASTGSAIQLTIGDATTSEWNNSQNDGLWTTSADWSNGTPNAVGITAKFGSLTGAGTVNMNGDKTVSGLIFDNGGSYTISGSGNLTLNNGGAAASVTVNNGNHTIAVPIVAPKSTSISFANSSVLNITGAISGGNPLSASGQGTLTLTGNNSFSTSTLNGATLNVGIFGGTSTSGTLGTGTLTMSANGTLNFNRSNAYVFPGGITGSGVGAGTVNQLGTGSTTVSGAITNITSVTISAGTLITGSTLNQSGGISLTGNGSLTASGSVSGSGGLTMNSTGTVNLNAANSYFAGNVTTAGTTINSGTVNLGAAGALPTNTALAVNGGVFNLGGNNIVITNILDTNPSTGVITNNGPANSTSNISFTGAESDYNIYAAINDGANGGKVALVTSITNAQSANFHILHLNATSTFSGGITVNSQSIEADTNNAFGTGPITLTLNNSSTNFSQVYLAQNVTINNNITVAQGHPFNNGAVILQTLDAGNTTINGSVTILANNFSGGLLGTQGTGVGAGSFLIINGAVYANGTADTIIQLGGNVQYNGGGSYANLLINGTAQIGANNGLAQNAVLQFGTVPAGTASAGILDLNGFNQTAVALSAPATSLGGSVTNNGAGNSTLTLNTAGTNTFTGSINGAISLVVGGTGTQQLTSFSTYSGSTTLTGSAVVEATSIGNGSGISSIGAASSDPSNLVFDGGTLRYVGTIASTDRGFTINPGKTAKIDVSTAATNLTWTGSSPASTGSFTKLGLGTLTIDASATHGYTGATTVGGGTLVVNDTLSNTTSVSIASGAVLAGNGTLGGTLNHTAGTINPGAVGGQSAGTITFSGPMTLNGGTVQYDVDGSQLGNNAAEDVVKANGGLTIAGPSIIDLEFLNPSSPPSSPFNFVLFNYTGTAVTQAQANNLSFITNIPARSNYTANVSIAGEVFVHVVPGAAANLTWHSTSSGVWDTLTANWLNGAVQDKFFNGDNVTFADGAGLQSNITMNQTLTPSSILVTANSTNYTFSGNGTLGGATSLTMNGTSTLTIKTNNTYSGGTTINSGTVDVGGSSSSGSLGNGSVTNNATLKFTRTDGNGVTPLTIVSSISGTGNLLDSCTGTSIMNGTISQGNITLNGGTTTLSGAVTVTGNLTVSGATLATSSGGISGSGGVVLNGTGSLVIQGSNSYDGNTTVNGGTLFPGSPTAFGSTVGSTTVNSGGEIYATAQTTDYGTESITINGTGVGGAGALRAGGATTSTFDGPVSVASNTTMQFDGGATLVLTNANALTGSNVTLTLLGGGTLQLNGNVSLGSGGAIATGTTPITVAPAPSSTITVSSPLTGNGTITATTSGTATQTTLGTTIFTADSPTYAGTVDIGVGSGNLQIQTSHGFGSTGQITAAGSGTTTALVGTLQLNGVSGPMTVANPILVGARQGTGLDVPHIENIAGNNTLTGLITTTTGGTDYNFASDAGTLTIQSVFATTGLTTARNLKLQGAGNGVWSGNITEIAAAPVTVIMNGTGTWTLGGANTYSGGTNVNAGTLAVSGSLTGPNVITAPGATFSVLSTGSISTASVLTNNGTMVFNNAQNTVASLTNSTGALVKLRGSAVKTSAYVEAGGTDAWASGMDLGVSKFILESTNKTADLAQLQNEVNFGKTNANGIFSTTLPAHFGIAVLDNAVLGKSTFGGIAVDANSVIVAAELLGDSNVDGHVDLTDLAAVLNNFGATTGAWTSGNFDGSATIDQADVLTVLNNFGSSYANAFAGWSSACATSATGVPEPASLAMLGLGAAMLISRRRKSTL